MSDSEAAFGKLLRRARALERLNRRVSGLLGADLARHCQVANVRDRRLIFACDSAACATQLRLQTSKLLEQLHAVGLEEIEGVEVKMTPPSRAG